MEGIRPAIPDIWRGKQATGKDGRHFREIFLSENIRARRMFLRLSTRLIKGPSQACLIHSSERYLPRERAQACVLINSARQHPEASPLPRVDIPPAKESRLSDFAGTFCQEARLHRVTRLEIDRGLDPARCSACRRYKFLSDLEG